ncbi:MAG: DUF308 domain-containing protein [Campylobacterota bacterium]|nr:DUF308 domain-containing protein [Campylobacterota bacterium]
MSQEIQNIKTQLQEKIKEKSGLVIATGIIVLLMGLLAMGTPFVAGLSIAIVIGVILIIGGIGQFVFALKTGLSLFTTILGALTVIVGVYMVMNPNAALGSLTILLAAYLISSGIFETVMSFQIKPDKGWGWALFSGIVSVLLGIMIFSQYPLSGAWAIGILLGLKLFFSGLTLMMLGLGARGVSKNLQSEG